MASQINASNSGFGGIVSTGDSSGVLQLQTVGTTAVTIDTSQNVGIGTTSPSVKFHTVGTAGSEIARFSIAADNFVYGTVRSASVSTFFGGADTSVGWSGTLSNHAYVIKTNDTERMRIDASGRITTPSQPAFYVRYSNGGLNVPNGLLVFDSVVTNVGSYYSTSTGRFTAPIAGNYLICFQIQHQGGNTTSSFVDLYLNGATVRGMRSENAGVSNYQTTAASGVITMAAGDYVQLYNYAATGVYWSDHTAFSGYLLG